MAPRCIPNLIRSWAALTARGREQAALASSSPSGACLKDSSHRLSHRNLPAMAPKQCSHNRQATQGLDSSKASRRLNSSLSIRAILPKTSNSNSRNSSSLSLSLRAFQRSSLSQVAIRDSSLKQRAIRLSRPRLRSRSLSRRVRLRRLQSQLEKALEGFQTLGYPSLLRQIKPNLSSCSDQQREMHKLYQEKRQKIFYFVQNCRAMLCRKYGCYQTPQNLGSCCFPNLPWLCICAT